MSLHVFSVIPDDMEREIRRLAKLKTDETEWALAELLACKSVAEIKRGLISSRMVDNVERVILENWFYLGVPILKVVSWMEDGQIKFTIIHETEAANEKAEESTE